MLTAPQQNTVPDEQNASQTIEENSNIGERNSASDREIQPEQEEQNQEEEQLPQPEDERIHIQLENVEKGRLGREQPKKQRPKRDRRRPAYLDNYLLY